MRKLMLLAAMLAMAPLQAKVPDVLALPGRPAAMVALDAGRQPLPVLAASHIKRGDHVLDVMAGQGYYSELLGRLVGPKGHVTAVEPVSYMDDAKTATGWAELSKRQPNVSLLVGAPGEVTLPQGLDAAFFHLTYHDLYWESAQYKYPRTDVDAFNARLFAAMKKGGMVIIIDHHGTPGVDPRVEADKTHRIDAARVRADMARAGFKFVGSDGFLENATDDPTKLVFDPAVRGKTSRFFYRFVKP
jgi:predicted methyltransferase